MVRKNAESMKQTTVIQQDLSALLYALIITIDVYREEPSVVNLSITISSEKNTIPSRQQGGSQIKLLYKHSHFESTRFTSFDLNFQTLGYKYLGVSGHFKASAPSYTRR